MRTIIISLTILSMFFYGCKNQAATHDHANETAEEHAAHSHEGEEKHDHEHEGEAAHDHEGEEGHQHEETAAGAHSDEIIFSKAQAAKTEFEVKEVQPQSFNQVIKTTGQILPAPGDESIIVATSNGTVSFASNSLIEGSDVRQGQTLFNIASRNMADGDHYSKVNANYQRSRAEYERAETLVKDKIISQKEFETIRLDYQNAKIAYDAIAGKQSSKGVGVTAPISGSLKNILVKDGEYVTVGQALGTVSQNKRLVLRAEVSEKHYKSLNNVGSANFKTPYDNQVYALSDLKGKLLSFGKASGNNSFFIPVSFEFDNKGEIVPGSFVEVFLLSKPIENAITIPVSALTNEMGTFYVYVQLDEEGYRKQEVKTGGNNGKEVQVLAGLQAGDRVVTKGAYQVKMASASGAIPHGHSHEH